MSPSRMNMRPLWCLSRTKRFMSCSSVPSCRPNVPQSHPMLQGTPPQSSPRRAVRATACRMGRARVDGVEDLYRSSCKRLAQHRGLAVIRVTLGTGGRAAQQHNSPGGEAIQLAFSTDQSFPSDVPDAPRPLPLHAPALANRRQPWSAVCPRRGARPLSRQRNDLGTRHVADPSAGRHRQG